jgi:hypothetical protein
MVNTSVEASPIVVVPFENKLPVTVKALDVAFVSERFVPVELVNQRLAVVALVKEAFVEANEVMLRLVPVAAPKERFEVVA